MASDEKKNKGEGFTFTDDQMFKGMAAATDKFKDVGLEALSKLATAIFSQGKSPKDALGLSDEQMEGLYGQAYRLFNNGRYGQAKNIFQILCLLKFNEPKYAMGLAACTHMQKEYDIACGMYLIVEEMAPDDPTPSYHVADCYMNMGDPLSAIQSLKLAVKKCGKSPEYSIIKDRAKMMIESVQAELDGVADQASTRKGGSEKKK